MSQNSPRQPATTGTPFERRYRTVHGRDLSLDLKERGHRAWRAEDFNYTQSYPHTMLPPPMPQKPIGALVQMALGIGVSVLGWACLELGMAIVRWFTP